MDNPSKPSAELAQEPAGDPKVPSSPSVPGTQPDTRKVKSGFGGCLLYPLFFLAVQPFLFLYVLATSSRSPFPNTITKIHWPYMIYDIVMLCLVGILLVLFFRKKATLPALFILFLVAFTLISGLGWSLTWRFPWSRVNGNTLQGSHFVMLLQCLILIPYFVLDERVKNTFTNGFDEQSILDRFVKPIAIPAGRLYGWLARKGKKVFLFTILFVVFVFMFDWIVDSIVLYLIIK
jgi:hypothetical protein